MKTFVVDASVAIKWFLPEIHSEAALRLRNANYELHVPKFLHLEIGNVLCKKQRQTELTQEESSLILE
jgi:predicted nucleic acid-binding protein